MKQYHIEEYPLLLHYRLIFMTTLNYGMDELFFRYVSLCKKIETYPHRLDELAHLDWVLSKALYRSMDYYVEETKQSLHSAEVNQYPFVSPKLLIDFFNKRTIRNIFYKLGSSTSSVFPFSFQHWRHLSFYLGKMQSPIFDAS